MLKSADLQLSDRQVRQILAEADENEDNVIEYKEFLPVMVDILQGIKVRGSVRLRLKQTVREGSKVWAASHM